MIPAGSALAEVPCDEAAAEARVGEIDRLLDDQRRKARLWGTSWAIGYGVATVGQGVFAWKPDWSPVDIDADFRESLTVSTVKAGIAGLARVVLPLKTGEFERADGESACAALPRAEKALRFTASKQKKAFMLGHIGGLVLNTGGSAVLLFAYDNRSAALLSFLLGTAVGAAQAYTQPRGAWKAERRWRAEGLTVVPVVTPEVRGVAVGWQF